MLLSKNGETLDTMLLRPFGKRVAGLFQVPSVAYNVEQRWYNRQTQTDEERRIV